MELKAKIKIHNRFNIEVKDVTTGEIVQRGQAENIILNNMFNSLHFIAGSSESQYVGASIQYGRGTGTLSPSRTTLFSRIDGKASTRVELVANQAPLTSYGTKKIVINANEHIGETFTEVGIGQSASQVEIFTHALIKDSEGNPLTLGPKTDTQEITIYATVFFTPNFETGITLAGSLSIVGQRRSNGLLIGGCCYSYSQMSSTATGSANTYINGASQGQLIQFNNISKVNGTIQSNQYDFPTSAINGKVKTFSIESIGAQSTSPVNTSSIALNFETLAENNSILWSGWEFDKTPIGVGDGSKTVFNLAWDEAWIEKPKSVYIDGVQVTSGFIFNSGNITFDTAPANGAVITADYWVKYAPKDANHLFRVKLIINFNEGSGI